MTAAEIKAAEIKAAEIKEIKAIREATVKSNQIVKK
jgi:hypothetical protein